MRRLRVRVSAALLALVGAATSGALVAIGCDAAEPLDAAGGGGSSGGAGGQGGGGGGAGAARSDEGFGGLLSPGEDAGSAAVDAAVNPCGTECGPEELCDQVHLGADDDCDGQVDETCVCIPGQAHACFMGDPSYRAAEGCFPGTALCDEIGAWGPCVGGRHATEACFSESPVGCHAMQAPPFADVNLKEGTGTFSVDAVPGSESWTVVCPTGIDPCPAVTGVDPEDDYKPLQSGEYRVTYTKRRADGSAASCEYALYVGAPGLRVELEWEHDLGGRGVDLDLHVHRPGDAQPWRVTGSAVDCGYNNCTVDHMDAGSSLGWFSGAAAPPDPVNWHRDPVEARNTCYFAPRGAGQAWRALDRGCHNPRLDVDNITCDPGVTDPNSDDFCAPENINIDFPPVGQWTRIGVHYYSGHGERYAVHPRVKIFCHGALGADLGPTGFYDPEAPVTFASSDSSTRYWLVADVAFIDGGECGEDTCVVRPLYEDEVLKTPLLTTRESVESSFGPEYPPPP
ncbi:hypothetical protein SOCE26_088680 [Sorangium cellulosum]|uniref:HYR domain-containing protein n=1 Tax=Sorangium cellulosum TaxID=56 RepID=A0A2L0F7D1_SORCE|nr:hypothetical protein [Sorangium cellulosum]AUX47349.1 hypothetical protein SOCE26_088680 [Sorangium cellulosum]